MFYEGLQYQTKESLREKQYGKNDYSLVSSIPLLNAIAQSYLNLSNSLQIQAPNSPEKSSSLLIVDANSPVKPELQPENR